ncbi:replication restart DNA helicase PriA [Azomonas agilis]|uniref:Replication restart protein PriA n=1 Tax=Azomonas agilis TaxID=116849 RepID=A0A562HZU1_9GAMM|nr:primosomal protein N' [Azomonas agilis]TWH64281.1 replication restart DNA helicase PriA [Azomonas agilis]
MSQPILRIALPSPLRALFDYWAPVGTPISSLLAGVRVRVPFGRRELVGLLIEVVSQSEVPTERLRPALALLDDSPLLPAPVFRLARWTAQYYQHSLGDTLAVMLPNLLTQGEPAQFKPRWLWQVEPNLSLDDPRVQRAPRQREALRVLAQHPQGVAEELLPRLQLSREALNSLRNKGLVRITACNDLPEPKTHQGSWLLEAQLALNSEQRNAYEAVKSRFGHFQCFLLAGVTGSGKTEVYLHLVHQMLLAGKQSLILIPEINLSPQTLARFQQRFNARIVVLHSGLTDRARLDAWLEARSGNADIVIGTRSALFTPLLNPGLIIVDEEHDTSYKQQESLRYQARDLAVVRAHMEQIPVVLGSATPSLESLHNAHTGRYALLKLEQRAGHAALPDFWRLDVKNLVLDAGISGPLQQAIRQTLAAGQQVLVFLNRRGYAPTLLCHHCGWFSLCPHCDARMTLHQQTGRLHCHHCDYHEPLPTQCPQCQQQDLRPIGAGTERAEQRLGSLFPQYPVLRVDRDSTRRKDSLDQILQRINEGKPCILVGTQMLAKGHHFPHVTLVAILDADGGLFSADFRAAEHMAQQITQVAGRAGRAGHKGQVIIQSHLADHPLLVQLTEQGYFAFADQALAERQAACLPPFSHMVLIRAEARQPQQAEDFLEQIRTLAEDMQQLDSALTSVELLGPIPALMERKAGWHRAQLLVQAQTRGALHRLLDQWIPNVALLPEAKRIRWILDVDPLEV